MPPSTIPPELFPLIASFIPLRSAPHTLRALALGDRRFHDIVRPILYSRIIVRNEDDALTVIQKILDEPQLGLAVTELYIMSELSVETRKGQKSFDVVAGLHMLVKKQLIPRTVALGIYLAHGWIYDENWEPIQNGRLLSDFWRNLRKECPRLRTLVLRNVGHTFIDPWQSGDVVDEMNAISVSDRASLPGRALSDPGLQGLSTLRMEWTGDSQGLSAEDYLKVLNKLPRLASSLHTLSLECGLQDATLILSFDFPSLKWLRLECFGSKNKTETIMGFFRRHPQLHSLSLVGCTGTWFSNDIEAGFLPNLKHLRVRHFDSWKFCPPK
jgi:hypothetical protein